MDCVMKFKQYRYYRWVYLMGSILVLVNGVLLQNMYITNFYLTLLFCILFYKSVHILIRYQKVEAKAYPRIEQTEFIKKYKTFRIRVLLFWLAFVVLCVVGKFVAQIEHWYFYCCTYFFLLLDRLFVNVVCLLRKFSDHKGEVVLCCCGCPCRGWDLMMIHTPLLFALQKQGGVENILICLASILAVISIICWEKKKYSLVEIKRKCKKSCDLQLCRENKNERYR